MDTENNPPNPQRQMNADKFKDYRSILSRHQNMDNITPMQDLNFCRAMRDLETQLLSYRDKFAMDFCKYTLKKLDSAPYNIDAIKDELDLYKHSLIK